MVVVLGVDGVADFNALHSRKHDHEVQLYAFDIMALDGEDLRALPLSMRKNNLARLLARRGIFVAPFEAGEIGPDLSARPAAWALRDWCRSRGTGRIRRNAFSSFLLVNLLIDHHLWHPLRRLAFRFQGRPAEVS